MAFSTQTLGAYKSGVSSFHGTSSIAPKPASVLVSSRRDYKLNIVKAVAEASKISQPSSGLNGASHAHDDIVGKLKYGFGKTQLSNAKDAYRGTSLSVREKLFDAFNKTHEHWE